MPSAHTHNFTALGVACARTERPGGPKLDKCYAIRLSAFDSESEEESTDWMPMECRTRRFEPDWLVQQQASARPVVTRKVIEGNHDRLDKSWACQPSSSAYQYPSQPSGAQYDRAQASKTQGVPLCYVGHTITLSQGAGVWLPTQPMQAPPDPGNPRPHAEVVRNAAYGFLRHQSSRVRRCRKHGGSQLRWLG